MPTRSAEPSGSDSLAELCRAAAAGDADALERLICTHHSRLLSFTHRRIGLQWQGKIEPEDVLQQAYIDVFARIGQFEYQDADSFYRWVTRIIDHRLGDMLRYWRAQKRTTAREHGHASSSYGSLLERCLPPPRTPSGAVRREEALGALLSCLARLPDDHRLAVQLLYLDEQTVFAAAAKLDRSEDAVRRLAGRALERLQRCMGRASRYLSSQG